MSESNCVDCGVKSVSELDELNCHACRHKVRPDSEKKALLNRCSRAEGQLRGIKRMIEADVYCDDVLNQIAAAQSALSALSRILLEQHMKSCLVERIQNDDETVIDELMSTINKLMR
jgi:DNA-binding FrmR family transcriptional regulator